MVDETLSESARRFLAANLFVRASELMSRVVVAAKDNGGRFFWITLEKDFHSSLVSTSLSLAAKHNLSFPVDVLKDHLFRFLIDILNGQPQADFFDKKRIEAKSNRANRERKRLARKRSRAAKREEKRQHDKLSTQLRRKGVKDAKGRSVTIQSRTCLECKKRFNSRKRLSKHKCPGPVVAEPRKKQEPQTKVNEAKRARRARARKARKERVRLMKINIVHLDTLSTSGGTVTQTAELPASSTDVKATTSQVIAASTAIADNTLQTATPVTGGSGTTTEECEDCHSPAVYYKTDVCKIRMYGLDDIWPKFPKCEDHRPSFTGTWDYVPVKFWNKEYEKYFDDDSWKELK